MTKIIAVILTKNEARHIGDCIKSLQWADQIIVEDSASEDGTIEIATASGAQVYQHDWINFAVARNAALDIVKYLGASWVLFVDADERVSPELAQEIQEAIQNPDIVGWWLPRFNVIWGHTMRGGGWYPDHQLRLMRVDAAHYDPTRQVHEIANLAGPAGHLTEHLIHYNYDTLAQFKAKQNRYLDFEAKILKAKGIRAKPWTYLTMPWREFQRRFISLDGYKDGWVGFQVCSLMAWYMFVTYLRLRKL